MTKKVYCIVEGCFDEQAYSGSGLCLACYAGMHYWKHRSPTDIVKRKRQLDRLASRMDYMQPTVRVAKRRRTG